MKARVDKCARHGLKRHKPPTRILRILFDKVANNIGHSKLNDDIRHCIVNGTHFWLGEDGNGNSA